MIVQVKTREGGSLFYDAFKVVIGAESEVRVSAVGQPTELICTPKEYPEAIILIRTESGYVMEEVTF